MILDLSAPIEISNPGYYVFDQDWVMPWGATDPAITINSDNVLIDLQGFLLQAEIGIYSVFENVAVQNGRIYALSEMGVALLGRSSRAQSLEIFVDTGNAVRLEGGRSRVSDSVLETNYGPPLALGTGATAQKNIVVGDESAAFMLSGASYFIGNRVSCGAYTCGRINGDRVTFAHNVVSVVTNIDNPIYVRGADNVIFNNLVLDADEGSPIFVEEGDGSSVYQNNLVLERSY